MLQHLKMNSKRKLLDKAKLLGPLIRIGKSGLTPGTISEIKRQLKAKKMIKIKLMKGELQKDRKKVAQELALKTNSLVIQQVGFVVVLYKEKVEVL